jgi:LytS/YehU family sensor histidine kinase
MILLFTWVVILRSEDQQEFLPALKSVSLNAMFFFGYAYLTGYILVPALLSRKKYLWFTLSFLLSGILISYLKFIFSDYLFYSYIAADLSERMKQADLSQLLVNTKDMTFIVAIFLIAKYSKDNYHLRKRLSKLKDQQVRSEISLLRNQLDPHVVFNNLNNLYCLSLSGTDTVGIHTAKLHSVLRYYFRDGKSETVSLDKEVRTIEDYIALEKLRYGERLTVSLDIEGNLENKRIIPFIFFSFVVNCIEHGASGESGDAWIKLFVRGENRSITFHASNSKPPNYLTADSSREYEQKTRKKLDMLYPGKYLLRIEDRKDMFCVDLKLKI